MKHITLKSLSFNEKFDTKEVKNMSRMFKVCVKLTDADVSKFDTRKDEDMSYMFHNCKVFCEIIYY